MIDDLPWVPPLICDGCGFCPQCGVSAYDEDGCCVGCGSTCTGQAVDTLALGFDVVERLRSDLAAALERERMALWALALEIGDPAAAPAGFQWLYPGWYHAASGRSAHTRDEVHATHLAAILSIDPTAKPPPGWNP